MPFHGIQNILLELQSSLLQAGDAGKNPGSDAVFRPKNDILPSDHSNSPRD
jgi:hypothetical protein